MTDPFNQLPADPEWVRKVNAIGEKAAGDLGAMVLMVAMQEGGKLAITLDGVPASGPIHDIAEEGVPKMLFLLSVLCGAKDAHDALGTRQ